MMRTRSLQKLVLIAIILSIGACGRERESDSLLPYYEASDLTPTWKKTSDSRPSGHHAIEPFSFIDQENDHVSNETFDGKIYVANFFFVHCTGICPTMRSNLSHIQDIFRKDPNVLLLSHSVMPETDTVPVLQNYAQVNGVDAEKWHLVTGRKETLWDLAKKSYFINLDEEVKDSFLHSEIFVLVDPARHIRGVYNGTLQTEVSRLIEDIRMLETEFSFGVS